MWILWETDKKREKEEMTDSAPLKVFSFLFAASNYFRHKGETVKGGNECL